MRLKMLIGMSGAGFVVDPGEETERFNDQEAARLIETGHAEEAPPVERKKPKTKNEWDEERELLLAENERLKADALSNAEQQASLVTALESLTGFREAVTTAIGVLHPPVIETTEQLNNREERS